VIPAQEIAATIDALRRAPGGGDELAALLPEHLTLYDGRSTAEVTRLRGYLLAAFADTGLPDAALPYAVEALESGDEPYEVAAGAIALRGRADAVPFLVRALQRLAGADATLSFSSYDPRWPYANPTTALTEILRTLAGLGPAAAAALPELDRLEPRISARVRPELEAARAAIGAAPDASDCCAPAPAAARPRECCHAGRLDAELEDQDGLRVGFTEFFSGKPSVLAFFYTRCENPYKCSLTVTRLAQLQALAGSGLKIAAITYDPGFDVPARLRRYGADRGVVFGPDVRFFRATAGFDAVVEHLGLGVGYGPSTVNRHRIELFALDADGTVTASFTRRQWQPEDVLDAIAAAAR
jgi:protein SCO1/2